MKADELKGRAVISLADAQKVGEINKVLLDLSNGRVAGFGVKHGLFANTQMLAANNIQSLGADAVMIADADVLQGGEHAADPSLADLDSLGEIKVVTDAGTLLGTLGMVLINPQTLAITDFQLSGSLWEHLTQGPFTFPAGAGYRFGGKLLIVPNSVMPEGVPGAESLASPAAPAAPHAASTPTPPGDTGHSAARLGTTSTATGEGPHVPPAPPPLAPRPHTAPDSDPTQH